MSCLGLANSALVPLPHIGRVLTLSGCQLFYNVDNRGEQTLLSKGPDQFLFWNFRMYSLNRPSGPIQSLSRCVQMLCVCVFVYAIADNLVPGGLETSG